MPLVQSLDLLRHQVVNPVFRGSARRRAREGAGGHGPVGRLRRARRRCFRVSTRRRCWRASAAATSTRFCAATSRTRRCSTRFAGRPISALIYPVILVLLAVVLVGIIVLKVVPAFTDFYASFNAELPLSTRIILGISNFAQQQFLAAHRRGGDRKPRVRRLDSPAGPAARSSTMRC